jgi:AcrR family transcriptional regulator
MGRKSGTPASRARPPNPWLAVDLTGVMDARERIIRTAYALYWRHGINAVGVDQVVAEAGVAKATLYRHFRSKEGLVVAVIERHKDVWTRDWLRAEVEWRATAPRQQVLAIFDAFDEWFHQVPFEGCLFLNTLTESHHQPSPVRDAAVAALEEVRVFVQGRVSAAGIRDADDFAHRIQLLMFGAITGALNGDAVAAQRARAAALVLLEQEPVA